MQFTKSFPEDPHNVYPDALVSGGWLSGFRDAALTAAALVGLGLVFVAAPWRRALVSLYSAFVGIFGKSVIIDQLFHGHGPDFGA